MENPKLLGPITARNSLPKNLSGGAKNKKLKFNLSNPVGLCRMVILKGLTESTAKPFSMLTALPISEKDEP